MEETDFKNLSLKKYRDKFCKNLSLEVLQRAYSYSKNDHLPQSAVKTAAALYAEPFKRRPLLQHGVVAENNLNEVTVWKLQTETPAAQRALLDGEWNFHDYAECVSRLGENFACKCFTTLKFKYDQTIGIFNHRHRFVAVVSIESVPVSAMTIPKVREIADIIAQNAVAYYPLYLCEQENPPKFREFLLNEPLRFVEGINLEHGLFIPQNSMTIADFIAHRGQLLDQKLSIASIDVFGDFEHL